MSPVICSRIRPHDRAARQSGCPGNLRGCRDPVLRQAVRRTRGAGDPDLSAGRPSYRLWRCRVARLCGLAGRGEGAVLGGGCATRSGDRRPKRPRRRGGRDTGGRLLAPSAAAGADLVRPDRTLCELGRRRRRDPGDDWPRLCDRPRRGTTDPAAGPCAADRRRCHRADRRVVRPDRTAQRPAHRSCGYECPGSTSLFRRTQRSRLLQGRPGGSASWRQPLLAGLPADHLSGRGRLDRGHRPDPAAMAGAVRADRPARPGKGPGFRHHR